MNFLCCGDDEEGNDDCEDKKYENGYDSPLLQVSGFYHNEEPAIEISNMDVEVENTSCHNVIENPNAVFMKSESEFNSLSLDDSAGSGDECCENGVPWNNTIRRSSEFHELKYNVSRDVIFGDTTIQDNLITLSDVDISNIDAEYMKSLADFQSLLVDEAEKVARHDTIIANASESNFPGSYNLNIEALLKKKEVLVNMKFLLEDIISCDNSIQFQDNIAESLMSERIRRSQIDLYNKELLRIEKKAFKLRRKYLKHSNYVPKSLDIATVAKLKNHAKNEAYARLNNNIARLDCEYVRRKKLKLRNMHSNRAVLRQRRISELLGHENLIKENCLPTIAEIDEGT